MSKKAKQKFLPDGNGGTLEPPSIKAIDDAADAYQAAKSKRQKKALELKEVELNCYDDLDKAMEKNLDKLGEARVYFYDDASGKRKQIKYGKARITIKTAKAEKKPAGTAINPDAGAELPKLD